MPPNYSVLSSITTLVSELTESGINLEESEQIVTAVLDLPRSIELSSFEPLKQFLLKVNFPRRQFFGQHNLPIYIMKVHLPDYNG